MHFSTLVFYAQPTSTVIYGRGRDVKSGMYSRFNSRKAVSAIVGYRVNIIPEKLFLFGHVWTFLINVIQAEGTIKLKNR